MKKAFFMFFVFFALSAVISCTPQALDHPSETTQACCGDDFTTSDPPPKL